MAMGLLCYSTIFCELIRMQLTAIRRQFPDMVINLYIWVFCSLVIMGYIMQSFGLASDYGCFQLASIMGTVGFKNIKRIKTYYPDMEPTPRDHTIVYECTK